MNYLRIINPTAETLGLCSVGVVSVGARAAGQLRSPLRFAGTNAIIRRSVPIFFIGESHETHCAPRS